MSLRPAPWPFSGTSARRAAAPEVEAPTRPDLKLVLGGKSPRLERLSPRTRVISLLVTVVAALFAIVAFHVMLSQGQFALDALQSKANVEQAQYERLRLQVSRLESPSRIAAEAENRMGMVTPDRVVPIAPSAQDMPKGLATTPGVGASSTSDDDNGWSAIKPHLSASAP